MLLVHGNGIKKKSEQLHLHITLDAFHVFKVFVANPNKIPEVEKILRDNGPKLCAYLETLHSDKEATDQQFADEKRLIIATIRNL